MVCARARVSVTKHSVSGIILRIVSPAFRPSAIENDQCQWLCAMALTFIGIRSVLARH